MHVHIWLNINIEDGKKLKLDQEIKRIAKGQRESARKQLEEDGVKQKYYNADKQNGTSTLN